MGHGRRHASRLDIHFTKWEMSLLNFEKRTHGIVPHNIIKNPTCYHSSLGVTTSRYCVLIIRSDYLYDHAPRRRTLSRTTDFDPLGQCPSLEDFVAYIGLRTRHWEWPPQDIVYSSLGVTTSMIMPLVGGLCHVQRTSTSGPTPLIGGLCHVQRTSTLWANAPRRRTLSRTMDFDPLGQRPSSEDFVTYNGLRPSGPTPLIGELCHVQRTSTLWVTMISRQGRAWHKTNDTSRVAPKSDAKRIPKDRMLQAVEESVRHNDNDLNYLGFEDFGWTL